MSILFFVIDVDEIQFGYTMTSTLLSHSGVERISPNISEVKISHPYPLNSISITFKLSTDELEWMGNDTSLLLCEVEVKGKYTSAW
jgi:hypothetical protein